MSKIKHSQKKTVVPRQTVKSGKKARSPALKSNDKDAAGLSLANEPSSSYTMRIPDSRNMMKVYVQKETENQLTAIEKMNMVRSGVTKQYLENLKKKASLDYDKLSKGLSIARATLINKKGKERFSSRVSEKILGLADIYSYGYEVFGEENRFNEWMFRPNPALGKHAPYDLIDNQFGRKEIKDLIGRIAYGVYS